MPIPRAEQCVLMLPLIIVIAMWIGARQVYKTETPGFQPSAEHTAYAVEASSALLKEAAVSGRSWSGEVLVAKYQQMRRLGLVFSERSEVRRQLVTNLGSFNNIVNLYGRVNDEKLVIEKDPLYMVGHSQDFEVMPFARTLYLLFIPFVMFIYWRRMRMNKFDMDAYMRKRWLDFVIMSALWPIGLLSEYPCGDTFVDHVRARVRQRLEQLSPNMPAWQHAFSCAAIVFAVVVSSLAGVRNLSAQQPKSEMHGMLQVRADANDISGSKGKRADLRLEHAFLSGSVSLPSAVTVAAMADLPFSQLKFAHVAVPIGTGVDLRFGQLLTAAGAATPPPHFERVIGGTEGAGPLSVFDIGTEVSVRGQHVGANIAVYSGEDPNTADKNAGKDIMLGVRATTPGKALLGEGIVQVGDQTNGWRTRWLGHLRLGLQQLIIGTAAGPPVFDITAAGEQLGGATKWGGSAQIFVPVHRNAEVGFAYDVMGAESSIAQHVARTQLSVFDLGNSLRAAILARWSSTTGSSATLRLQATF